MFLHRCLSHTLKPGIDHTYYNLHVPVYLAIQLYTYLVFLPFSLLSYGTCDDDELAVVRMPLRKHGKLGEDDVSM